MYTSSRVVALSAIASSDPTMYVTPDWGREWEAFFLLSGGLVTAGALILEHRGHRNAAVAILVFTALTGGVLTALRVFARRVAAQPQPPAG